MISIWHLLWIVPLSATAGFLAAGLARHAHEPNEEEPQDPEEPEKEDVPDEY